MSKDAWNEPTAPVLAPGLRMGPRPAEPVPTMELEQVIPPSDEVLALQAKIKQLEHDNQVLMNQIEEAWAVIKSRDAQILIMQETHQSW